jgi:hypothetical protein
MGRPRKDRATLMGQVLTRISRGELVREVAKDVGIHEDTVREWARDPLYSVPYARAREEQAHALAEEAIAIADGLDQDGEARVVGMIAAAGAVEEKDRQRVMDALAYAAVQRDRIRVDARKWLASKIAPRYYGDRMDVTSGDKPLTAPQTIVIAGREIAF